MSPVFVYGHDQAAEILHSCLMPQGLGKGMYGKEFREGIHENDSNTN